MKALLRTALLICAIAVHAAPSTTTISGIIYRADGTAATGTLLISWPAFNTPDGQAVAAGTMSLAIGPTGAISLALAPTAGATPAGVAYKVIYKLDDGTTATETWVVPTAGPTTIAAIRARVTSSNTALAWGNATQLQGKPIATTAPQNGQTLIYSAVSSRYEPQTPSGVVPDADAITKGKLQLAGDLAGTASTPTVPGLASKANQSALDAANSTAATHYSSTAAHSATATPAENRIVMSGTSGKLDKGWLPSAVDPMTLGTGANGSALSIKSPDASNFLRISTIDNGSNPGQSDPACGTMHDIFYPYGYNSIYGANYDSSKPSFEETLETNWCPGDGHAYFEWYKQFYAPWAGGASQPFRPIFFSVRKDGATRADYTLREVHSISDLTLNPDPTDTTHGFYFDVKNGIFRVTGSIGSSDLPILTTYATNDCAIGGIFSSCRTVTQNLKAGACTNGEVNTQSDGQQQVCITGAWQRLATYTTAPLSIGAFIPAGSTTGFFHTFTAQMPTGVYKVIDIIAHALIGVPTCSTTQPTVGIAGNSFLNYDGNFEMTLAAGQTDFGSGAISYRFDTTAWGGIHLTAGAGCPALPALNVSVVIQRIG